MQIQCRYLHFRNNLFLHISLQFEDIAQKGNQVSVPRQNFEFPSTKVEIAKQIFSFIFLSSI